MPEKISYFEKAGKENTLTVIEAVKERLLKGDINYLVVASTTGETALAFSKKLSDFSGKMVVVGEHTGFWGGDKQIFSQANKNELQKLGAKVLIASHALSGIERSISKKFGGVSRVEMIAHAFRMLGCEGIKVCVEIAVMAADAGFIPTDKDIIAVGGTGKGADTAVVLQAAHMNNFFDLQVKEILAKPRERK